MEAFAFRDGALRADAVPLDELRATVSDLGDGEWIWVDAVDPSTDDLTTLQKQPDLHDLAVEYVQQRDQRPKLDLGDLRMAQSADQLNEVMKKLSAWAGNILVPTLIAGIYGMNFDQMPELHWTLGYPLALGMMVASAVALYVGFRKRGWL
ncbi:MAG TPA: CorA family divalent cation transporter [Actinomycetota bacterium]|nr:CorA family divalent cation transporter [Actinomycetota bacterium]